MGKLIELKKTLFEMGLTQKELSKRAHIPENWLSMAIRGRYALSQRQREKISSVLNKSITDLGLNN